MDFENKSPTASEKQLLEALGNLSESISFCASGASPLVLPGLTVDGVGEIALPVSAANARRLIKQASQAPYGRGEATIVDTDVRRVWQLAPDQFRLENPKWRAFVSDVTNAVKAEFGIKQTVTADLRRAIEIIAASYEGSQAS